MSNYVDIDITRERLNDEIECIDDAIGEHIDAGVAMKDLWSLASLRAKLSLKRMGLNEAMDKAESVTEVHMDVEGVDFDTESYMTGDSFITVE